jgi:hypothetical protein
LKRKRDKEDSMKRRELEDSKKKPLNSKDKKVSVLLNKRDKRNFKQLN